MRLIEASDKNCAGGDLRIDINGLHHPVIIGSGSDGNRSDVLELRAVVVKANTPYLDATGRQAHDAGLGEFV